MNATFSELQAFVEKHNLDSGENRAGTNNIFPYSTGASAQHICGSPSGSSLLVSSSILSELSQAA
jgi:hypothetical protein